MNISLRPSGENDLDYVLAAEQSTENRRFVTGWTREQHQAAQTSADLAHLIIETVTDGTRIGYVILAGLLDTNQSIEFRRIVVTEKSKGYGRGALRLIMNLAFEEWGAHRLWLDVKEHNARARQLYEDEGFVVEGFLRECVKSDSGFDSLVLFSMLREEYLSAAANCLKQTRVKC